MSIEYDDVREQIENGNHTAGDIAEAIGIARQHVNLALLDFVEEGKLTRDTSVRPYRYEIPTPEEAEAYQEYVTQRSFDAPSVPTTRGSLGGNDKLKPDRSLYDFDGEVPEPAEIPTYYDANGEYDRIKAVVEMREEIGHPARVRISGPQGAGKTLIAANLAADNQWPLFTINAGDSVPSDLKGTATMIRDGDSSVTRWADGTLTKAMLSAAERPTLLLIDEVNRAPPEVKSPLFSALDFRGAIEIPFTGEKVRANPMNLIVVSTMNEGREFHGLKPLDAAEKRRISKSGKFNVEYLGVNNPEKEVELLTNDAPIGPDLAGEMVEVANHVRRLAKDKDGDSDVRQGIPTSELISWAKVAAAYDTRGVDQPVMSAADDVILGGVYEHDGGAANPEVAQVRTIISSRLKDAPADPVAFAEWAGLLGGDDDADDDEPFCPAWECTHCDASWETDVDAEDAGVTDDYSCVECDVGDVVRGE